MNPDYISTDPVAKKIIFLLTMATRTLFVVWTSLVVLDLLVQESNILQIFWTEVRIFESSSQKKPSLSFSRPWLPGRSGPDPSCGLVQGSNTRIPGIFWAQVRIFETSSQENSILIFLLTWVSNSRVLTSD